MNFVECTNLTIGFLYLFYFGITIMFLIYSHPRWWLISTVHMLPKTCSALGKFISGRITVNDALTKIIAIQVAVLGWSLYKGLMIKDCLLFTCLITKESLHCTVNAISFDYLGWHVLTLQTSPINVNIFSFSYPWECFAVYLFNFSLGNRKSVFFFVGVTLYCTNSV